MKKKLSCLLLTLILLTGVILLSTPARANAVHGLTYKIVNNGVTITGGDDSISSELIIPATIEGYPVTRIGEQAFYNYRSLTSVTIPDSVIRIGKQAFSYCTSLTSVTIPDGVIRIEDQAFADCNSLTSVMIPDSVTTIGECAFYRCTSLTGVTIGNSVTGIGNSAFSHCTSLTSVTIGNSVTSIGNYAFSGCTSLTRVTIPESINSIGHYVFENCTSLECSIYDSGRYLGNENNPYLVMLGTTESDISEIVIHPKTKVIYQDAFYDCGKLTSVTVPDGVIDIGESAFASCHSLTSVTIPDGVTSIGDSVFKNCTSLTSVTIHDRVTSIGDFAFCNCTRLISITIPNSVTRIGGHAFSSCTGLTSITIPDSVTEIDAFAFIDCTALVDIYFAGSAPNFDFLPFSGVDGATLWYSCGASGWDTVTLNMLTGGDSTITNKKVHSFASGKCTVCGVAEPDLDSDQKVPEGLYYAIKDGKVTITDCDTSLLGELIIPATIEGYPVTGIGEQAFYDCESLTSVMIPDSVTSIGEQAFYNCDNLTSMTIPDSVTSIGNSAFYYCTGLTSVTIGNSVTSIGNCAFYRCTRLTRVTIPESINSIGNSVFEDCTSLECSIYDSGRYLGNENNSYLVMLETTESDISEIVIHPKTKVIYQSAFYNCDKLTSVTIPDSVTSIGDDAFRNCNSLTSVTIGNSVTSIGECAFENCYSLTNMTIPDSVTSIKNSAFCGCNSLISVMIGDGVTSIGNWAFATHWGETGCSSLTSLTIGNNVTSIGHYAFTGCDRLTSVTIPDNVTSIGQGAFEECKGLTSVTIGNSVTSIGMNAFYECAALSDIYFTGDAPSFGSAPFEGVDGATLRYSCGASGWATVTSKVLTGGNGTVTIQADHAEVIDKGYAATCTATGLTEGKHCSGCGEVLVAQTVIDALGHSYINSVCSVCGFSSATATADESSITLTWNAEDGIKSWIYLGTSKNTLELLYSCTGGTYTITGLEPDTTYYIQLSHFINGKVVESQEILEVKTAVKPEVLKPIKITGLNASNATETTFTLTWDAIEGATKYWVYVDGVLAVSSATNAASITKRTPDTTYTVKVTACLSDGTILALADAEALTVKTLAEENTGVSATATAGLGSISLTWDVEDCTKTWIYLGTSADDLKLMKSTTAEGYTLTGLQHDTTYYIRLAHYINNKMVMSEEILEVTTQAQPSLTVSAQLTGSDLTLDWEANADSYKYWVTMIKDGKTLTYSTRETSFTLTGFDPATCTVTVRGINSNGIYDYDAVEM